MKVVRVKSESFVQKNLKTQMCLLTIFMTMILSSSSIKAACSNLESLGGCSFAVKRAPLPNLIHIPSGGSSINNIISAPAPSLYKNGSIRVVGPYSLHKKEGFKIIIQGNGNVPGSPKSALGAFFIPKASMAAFLQTRASTVASESFGDVEFMLSSQYQCNIGSTYVPTSAELTESPRPPQRTPQEVRDNIREQRRQIDRSPEATRRRQRERTEAIERGSARAATGATTSTADGSGLINMREEDPNADNETAGCEVLRKDKEENGDELNEETLTSCLDALREKIFSGLPRNLQNTTSNRDTVFKRMVALPNEEQEFLGAIFTVKGEANDSNPIEGAMVLKVLSNRRNNANELEAQIKTCEESGGSTIEIQECLGKVNQEGKYNLLDIAIDPMQFSMYNTPELQGNWHTTIGPRASTSSFRNPIKSFLFYAKMEDVTLRGGSDHANINQVYHYNTTAQYNAAGQKNPWGSRTPALDLSVEVDGETYTTSSHKFYYNVDSHGARASDGWSWNVKSEFKDL